MLKKKITLSITFALSLLLCFTGKTIMGFAVTILRERDRQKK